VYVAVAETLRTNVNLQYSKTNQRPHNHSTDDTRFHLPQRADDVSPTLGGCYARIDEDVQPARAASHA
jgi:hypothetical protein